MRLRWQTVDDDAASQRRRWNRIFVEAMDEISSQLISFEEAFRQHILDPLRPSQNRYFYLSVHIWYLKRRSHPTAERTQGASTLTGRCNPSWSK